MNSRNEESEYRRILGNSFIDFRTDFHLVDEEEVERTFLRVRSVNWDQLMSISREFYDETGRIELIENTRIQITRYRGFIEIAINDFS